MASVRREIEIAASPERVWEVLIDAERLPQYNVTIVEVRNPTGPLDQVGSSYDAVAKVYGRQIEGRWEVTDVIPLRRIAQVAAGPGGSQATVNGTIEPSGDGTRAAVEVDYQLPAGFLGEVANRLFIERSVERDVRHTLENLKELVEGESTAT